MNVGVKKFSQLYRQSDQNTGKSQATLADTSNNNTLLTKPCYMYVLSERKLINNITLMQHEHYIPFQDDKIQQDPNLSSEVFATHDLS